MIPPPVNETPILAPDTVQKALNISAWLKDKKAEDIVILNMCGASPVAEAMIIVSAQGARHAQALADWTLKNLAESGMTYLGMEGFREGKWILLDCNDVLVHIFQQESRRFYNLDGLWAHCPTLAQNGSPSVSLQDAALGDGSASGTQPGQFRNMP